MLFRSGGVRCYKKGSFLEDVYTYNDFSHEGGNRGCEPKKAVTPDVSRAYLISEFNGHMFPTKPFDSEEHRRFTGQPNELILENFEYLVGTGTAIWVRTPIIPGATDTDANIAGLAGVVRNRVERWELCAFNNLCADKYTRLGQTWAFKGVDLMRRARMEELEALARKSGAPEAVFTGSCALEYTFDETPS